MTRETTINELLESIGVNPHQLAGDVARIEVHENKVLGAKLVPGLEVDAKGERDETGEVEEEADVDDALGKGASPNGGEDAPRCGDGLPEEDEEGILSDGGRSG